MDKIICIGKNYLDHAKELGDAVPPQPLVFFKPPSSLLHKHTPLPLPRGKGEVHHELEIVLKLSAQHEVIAINLGLDLTLRTLQNELKSKGHPWERAKAFPNSAVLSDWHSLTVFGDYLNVPFYLKVNGTLKQRGVGNDMRLPPKELIQLVAQDFKICEGDLLFTGTPSGVGPLNVGDQLEFGFEGKEPFLLDVI